MKNTLASAAKCLFPVFACTIVTSCVTPSADYVAAGFTPAEVNHIAVLPIVDHRVDQSKRLNLDKWLHRPTRLILKRKGYSSTIHKDRSMVESIRRSDLASPSAAWISSLPPEQERWVLLLVLNDSSSRLTFGSTGNAELRGYLFDKQTRTVLWREQETGRFGSGGLIGMTMIGVMERTAIEKALHSTMASLPSRK